ncbi:YlqD family protein [Vampirovibrio sp.]|uniref:YlqD family protein n=1 Tax=Vampirovibrio sp. TaxID=2717857 RepID=UPI003592EA1C
MMQSTVDKAMDTLTEAAPMTSNHSIQLKRQITVKTKVTDNFRVRAKSELDNELKLIDTQSQQLEAQFQYSLQQLEKMAHQGQNVQGQLQQLNQEAQQKRSQMASLKMQISSELGNLDKIENGQFIVTGMLENTVELRLGDNLYDHLQNAEILVEDGVITAING